MTNIKLYLSSVDMVTSFGELMMMNNQLSKEIEQKLKKSSILNLNNFQVFETLHSMKPLCKFTTKLYQDLCTKMSSKTLFKFALSKDLGISMSRFIEHDEYMGLFSSIFSESLPLFFKEILNLVDICEGLDGIVTDEEARAIRAERVKKAEETGFDLTRDYDKDILDKERAEEIFIDFLLKIMEIYVHLNFKDIWNEVRSFSTYKVDRKPFSFA